MGTQTVGAIFRKKKELAEEKKPVEVPHEVAWKDIVGRINASLDFVMRRGRGNSKVRIADIVNAKYLEAAIKKTDDASLPRLLGKTEVSREALEETRKLVASLNEAAEKGKKPTWG